MTDLVIIATTVTEMGSRYYRKFRYGQEYCIGHRSYDGDRSGCMNLSGASNLFALPKFQSTVALRTSINAVKERKAVEEAEQVAERFLKDFGLLEGV